MKKLKAISILGVLALTGLTLLTTAPASGNGSFLITSMVSRLKRFCAPGELRPGCRYLANLIVPASPFLDEIAAGEPIPPSKLEPFLRIAVARMAPIVAPERTCLGCQGKVKKFEDLLAGNGTARSIVDMMDDACVARFRKDTTLAQQCTAELRFVIPTLIDVVLAHTPPATACSSGKHRPMNLCAE